MHEAAEAEKASAAQLAVLLVHRTPGRRRRKTRMPPPRTQATGQSIRRDSGRTRKAVTRAPSLAVRKAALRRWCCGAGAATRQGTRSDGATHLFSRGRSSRGRKVCAAQAAATTPADVATAHGPDAQQVSSNGRACAARGETAGDRARRAAHGRRPRAAQRLSSGNGRRPLRTARGAKKRGATQACPAVAGWRGVERRPRKQPQRADTRASARGGADSAARPAADRASGGARRRRLTKGSS
ncbi:hypothetical protein TvY486_0028140 [Trypanosoma vivax Y486]|uniref:Uncharacterized protein n=1 Tax=Trypanosoma vivax (strain Y486) TaxID=1055687 RepID=F9WR65_TRYVY|nr:hypothetical protein TvY486_0028140 [Trypanosoma vivax Y486]|eukprot:CCD20049.1 hypothetical protein TvY486_0028140 [Trypanosoma vivax Y486]